MRAATGALCYRLERLQLYDGAWVFIVTVSRPDWRCRCRLVTGMFVFWGQSLIGLRQL